MSGSCPKPTYIFAAVTIEQFLYMGYLEHFPNVVQKPSIQQLKMGQYKTKLVVLFRRKQLYYVVCFWLWRYNVRIFPSDPLWRQLQHNGGRLAEISILVVWLLQEEGLGRERKENVFIQLQSSTTIFNLNKTFYLNQVYLIYGNSNLVL